MCQNKHKVLDINTNSVVVILKHPILTYIIKINSNLKLANRYASISYHYDPSNDDHRDLSFYSSAIMTFATDNEAQAAKIALASELGEEVKLDNPRNSQGSWLMAIYS